MGGQDYHDARRAGHAGGSPGGRRPFWRRVDLFYWHLLWMIVLGVAILYWLGSFTDWLQTVIGLLGLGGIFAWIAVLAKVVSDDRKLKVQQWFDGLLSGKRMSLILAVITALALIIACNLGCIIADSGRDPQGHHMEIRVPGSARACWSRSLVPSRASRFVLCTGFGGRAYEIDVEGLPLRVQRVRPFSRVRLRVPGDFLRGNVILVRPKGRLSRYSSEPDADHQLVVRVGDNDPYERPFRGHSVWIGSGRALAVPLRLRQQWQIEVGPDPDADEFTLVRWLQPEVFEKIPELKAGQKVEISVKATGVQEAFARVPPIDVLPCEGQEDFPRVIDIEKE